MNKISNYNINNNPDLVRLMIKNAKKSEEKYLNEYPDSIIWLFESELHQLGYEFEISSQIIGFMPKHKKIILPIAIRYYKQAKYENEKEFFLSFFRYKGFDEVIPMLLDDFYNQNENTIRCAITECLYMIRSSKYIAEYLKIISIKEYGQSRAMIIMLLGKLKVYDAIPLLINLLEEENIRSHVIIALGDLKREELRPYFERYVNDKHYYWRKYAKAALKKLQ